MNTMKMNANGLDLQRKPNQNNQFERQIVFDFDGKDDVIGPESGADAILVYHFSSRLIRIIEIVYNDSATESM